MELFPEDADNFRFNSISRKECISFVNHPDTIALIRSTGDITNTPHANTGLADNFKVSYSPADLFKKYIKRDASLFNTFKEVKILGCFAQECHRHC